MGSYLVDLGLNSTSKIVELACPQDLNLLPSGNLSARLLYSKLNNTTIRVIYMNVNETRFELGSARER